MGRKQAVTYQDIAEYTGFSKATISRYFNDRDSLTLEKQDTISEALKKLDYRQNKVARVLANGKTEMVGILLPDLYHHFYYQILNKILGTYREFGFKFLVFNGDHNEEVERRYLQELMAYKVEGMIVLSNTLSSEELAGTGIPIVAIEREDRSISLKAHTSHQAARPSCVCPPPTQIAMGSCTVGSFRPFPAISLPLRAASPTSSSQNMALKTL